MAPPVTLPGVYEVILEMQNVSNQLVTWRNTYSFISANPPVFNANIVAALMDFQQRMIHTDAQVSRVSGYNWARGRQPYPTGTPLFSQTVALVGTADAAWGFGGGQYVPLGGEICVRVDHEGNVGGKPGRSFFRGLVGKNEVSSISGGRYSIPGTSPVNNGQLQIVLTASTLSQYIGGQVAGQQLCIVRFSRKTNTVHGNVAVQNLILVDYTTNKQTRKNPR